MTDALPPPGWPPEVRPITVEQMARLGIGDAPELFWDGRRVEVRRRLVRTGLQQTVARVVSAAAVAGAGVAGGVGAAASGTKDGAEFLCVRQFHWACPPERS